MQITVTTTEGGGPLDGIFWSSYLHHGGPEPDVVLELADSNDRHPARKLAEALLLFHPLEVLRLFSAQILGWSLTRRDRRSGLHNGLGELLPSTTFRQFRSLNCPQGKELLRRYDPDVLISVGAPEIFDEEVLDIPQRLAVNVHNGRLPEYRGMFGTFWERYHGEEWGWVTVHEMDPAVDAGDPLAEAKVQQANTLFRTLGAKKKLGGKLLARVLQGRHSPPQQQESQERGVPNYYSWPTLREMLELRRR